MSDPRVLRARVHDALMELRSIRCTDHAASEAVNALRLTEETLAQWWAPTLDRLPKDEPGSS